MTLVSLEERVTLQLNNSPSKNYELISELFNKRFMQNRLLVHGFQANTLDFSKKGQMLLVIFEATYRDLSGLEEVRMLPVDSVQRQRISSNIASIINSYIAFMNAYGMLILVLFIILIYSFSE